MLHFHIHVVIHFILKRNWHEISLVLLIVLVSLIKTLNKSWYYQQQQQSPGSSHSPDPQFWEWALNFGKVVVPKKNGQFWEGKNFLCTPQKKVMLGNGYAMCFLQKKWKKSVKFGLGKRSNISLPHIGGSHPVPSLSRETGYSNVLEYQGSDSTLR